MGNKKSMVVRDTFFVFYISIGVLQDISDTYITLAKCKTFCCSKLNKCKFTLMYNLPHKTNDREYLLGVTDVWDNGIYWEYDKFLPEHKLKSDLSGFVGWWICLALPCYQTHTVINKFPKRLRQKQLLSCNNSQVTN